MVYTEFEELSFDRLEGFVQLTEVVPALTERRQARAYIALPDGSFRLAGEPLELPGDVVAVSGGPATASLLALTGDGVSALRLYQEAGNSSLALEPILAEVPVLRGSRSFLPGLELAADLDGDPFMDLLFPARDGIAVFRGAAAGFSPSAVSRIPLPGDGIRGRVAVSRRYPIPRIGDLDGDRRPDLFLPADGGHGLSIHARRGGEGARFGDAVDLDWGCLPAEGNQSELAFIGDLDGSGPAELVTRTEVSSEDDGLKEAKKPRFTYRFYRIGPDLALESHPYHEMEVLGYHFGGELTGRPVDPFRDLDGDGRKELITTTLDFSMFQILRVLATKKLGIGLDFIIYHQEEDGSFNRVPEIKLNDKILLDLNNIRLDRLGNFSGDFDGDGLIEFLTTKDGRDIKLHRGRPGAAYDRRPDYEIRLAREPQDPALLKVQDLDGDGASDLVLIRLMEPPEPGASPPVFLDLHMSRWAD